MRVTWEDRIQRAEELKRGYPSAAAVLEFYRAVAEYQKDLQARFAGLPLQVSSSEFSAGIAERGKRTVTRDSGPCPRRDTGVTTPDTRLFPPEAIQGPPARWTGQTAASLPALPAMSGIFPSFLSFVRQVGTSELTALAERLLACEEGTHDRILESYWRGDLDPSDFNEGAALFFFAKAFLQPYAECLAARQDPNAELHDGPWSVRQEGRAECPFCGHPPQLGILRPEGEGARRSLLCSLCATEWRYQRLLCPACGEQDFSKLFYSRAEDFPHIRVDLCESCKTYLKTLDHTIDGRAVPVVDEIAALPLDVWAVEQGYTKVELNLIGM